MEKYRKYLNKAGWIVAAVVFYFLALAALLLGTPGAVQTVCMKFGNVMAFGYVGYWFSVSALGYIDLTDGERALARAIIIGASMIAGGLGL